MARDDWDWRGRYFPPSVPLPAKGGIRAQTKRGQFGQSWWAKRWIAVLESLQYGGRLDRGRNYARRGQVTSITVGKGRVAAKVQGSRPKPYDVDMSIQPLGRRDWKKVAEIVSRQAVFAAKLLAGEMPAEIESAFRKANVSLFPEKARDLETECSCPDFANPCKHIAAVFYLLGEEFDRDPFLMFRLRGMDREEFLGLLAPDEPHAPAEAGPPPSETVSELALPSDPGAFWAAGALPEHLAGERPDLEVSAAVPKRLGSFPFWRGREPFLDAMESIYRAAAQKALSLLEAQPQPPDSGNR